MNDNCSTFTYEKHYLDQTCQKYKTIWQSMIENSDTVSLEGYSEFWLDLQTFP